VSEAIVVGAGVFGLATARELAGRGWSVRLVDRVPPGTAGPSAARLRILRCAHGPDEWYASSAWRARSGWQALAAECGRELFEQCGVLLFADPSEDDPFEADPAEGDPAGWLRASLVVLRRLGIPAQRLAAAEVAERFPGLDGQGAGFALYEPMAGVLRAREAMLALWDSAVGRGVRLIQATARPDGAGVVLDGSRIEADLVVWAAGCALPELFPGLTSITEVPEGMVEFAPLAQADSAPHQARPAWVDRGSDRYGLPALDGFGERVGPVNELADPRWRADLRRRRPELADQPVPGIDPCAFAAMPDRHFLLARHPEQPRTWLVGGDSGHGFKHGIEWGRYVSDVLEGRQQPLPRFRLR
jgi:sarcosine oxidase